MKTHISSKGQIVLPARLRELDHIEPGQQFDVDRLSAGEYLLRRIPEPGTPGLLDWLRDCPDQHWFQEIASESTDTL